MSPLFPPVTYEIGYDNLGRPDERHTYAGATNIAEFNYTFDDNGNITDQVFGHRASDPSQSYAYDTLDRLTEADYIGGEDEAFTYDKLGNRVSVTLRNNNVETYAVDSVTNQYDASGTYTVTHTYDEAGNLAADHRGYTYSYDYENRLVKIQEGANPVVEYAYDALGRRSMNAVYDDETYLYYYDGGWRVLAEYAAEDVAVMRKRYVYGNYLDEVLLVQVGNYDYYYAHDHLYSPVALLSFSGGILERYEYDAYGRRHVFEDDFDARSGSHYGLPIAFTGQRLDVLDGGDLQVMYYKNRYYDVEMGRFLTRDPIGYRDGMNLYQYVKSVPIYSLDTLGLIPHSNYGGGKSGVDPKQCMVSKMFCMEGSTSPCCGAGYPGTTYGFPSPDAPRTRMPDTRANTVGERCKYTGESKVKSKSKKVTYTRNPKNPFGGVTVEESLYRCNCEVKCEDYDLGVVDSWLGAPVLGWMRDSSGDFTDYEEIEGGDYGLIVYASYDDFKKAWDELEAMNRNLSPSISVPNDPDHSSIGLYDKDWMQDFIDRMRESCPNNKAYDDYIQDLVNDLTSECEKYCNDNKGKKVD